MLLGLLVPVQGIAGSSADKHLRTRTVLSLETVRQIAAAAEAVARRNNWNVSIAIVDESGRLLHFLRMDDSSNSSVDIAIAKAQHAANYRRDTGFHQNLLADGNNVVLALPAGMPIEGGLRLVVDGNVIGGIGVSGVQASEDGRIAQAGVDWLGE
ncbi:GlcG/HbpS family heme-binding protein [Marilutibacter chinensis]|uniref:Heme-binding protein n=1 Tax=Marilutibacter chinensis TaxID=2912247 RepID=A0ABS9HNH0_9GAMM|nr:heme-binding protein [Lysobacter chinensis]MCF7220546.1 heme-binding protein [Lysobacter chinensis]